MKYFILLSIFIQFSINNFAQFSKAFEKIDSLNSYKDIEFGAHITKTKAKMGLIYKKGSDGFIYSISNKRYLAIDSFNFIKGEAWFLFNKLKLIILKAKQTDTNYFQNLLVHFTTIFGKPNYRKDLYEWFGNNLAYTLSQNKLSNIIEISIMRLGIIE